MLADPTLLNTQSKTYLKWFFILKKRSKYCFEINPTATQILWKFTSSSRHLKLKHTYCVTEHYVSYIFLQVGSWTSLNQLPPRSRSALAWTLHFTTEWHIRLRSSLRPLLKATFKVIPWQQLWHKCVDPFPWLLWQHCFRVILLYKNYKHEYMHLILFSHFQKLLRDIESEVIIDETTQLPLLLFLYHAVWAISRTVFERNCDKNLLCKKHRRRR